MPEFQRGPRPRADERRSEPRAGARARREAAPPTRPKRPTSARSPCGRQCWATHAWLGTFYRERARYAEAVREYELAPHADARQRARLLHPVRHTAPDRSAATTTASPRAGNPQPSSRAWPPIRTGARCCRICGDSTRRSCSSTRRAVSARRTTCSTATWRAPTITPASAPRRSARYERAVTLVDQALTVDPRDVDARISAAAYHAKIGNRRAAIEQLNRLPSDLSDPHVLLFGAVNPCRPGRPGDGVERGWSGPAAAAWSPTSCATGSSWMR